MSKRKFTREQARSALLTAGQEILGEVGLSGGVGRVTLAEAINRSGVPRPSAYRVFGETELDPQRAFNEELIVEITGFGPKLSLPELAQRARVVFADTEALGVDATPENLTWLSRELIRVLTGALSCRSFATETEAGVYLSVLAATLDTAPNERVASAARIALDGTVSELIPFVREALSAFGLRLREGWTLLDVASALVSAVIGAVLTAQVTPAPAEMQRPTGQGGTDQPWTPLGLTVLGITAQVVEPDPRMVAAAQPMRWFD